MTGRQGRWTAPLLVALLAGVTSAQPDAAARARVEAALATATACERNDRRLALAAALNTIRPLGAAAVPALIDTLDDVHPLRSEVALAALVQIGPAAVPGLVRGLSNSRSRVRWGCSTALGQIGEPAVAATAEALGAPYSVVREGARDVLTRIGAAAIPAVLATADAPDPEVRRVAQEVLGDALPYSVGNRRLSNTYVPWTAAERDRLAEPLCAAVVAALRDPDPGVRSVAARSLGRTPPLARRAIPIAIEVLEHEPEPGVRVQLAWLLSYGADDVDDAAISALARAARREPLGEAREGFSRALIHLADLSKQRGEPRWWVVPAAFFPEGLTLAVLIATWAGVLAGATRRRPRRRAWRLAVAVASAAAPGTLCFLAARALVFEQWPLAFLPEPPGYLWVDPGTAFVLSIGAAFVMVAVGIVTASGPPAGERRPEAA